MSKDLFKEIIPSLTVNNNYQMDDPQDEKSYVPFVVNKALSANIDTVLYANDMAINHHLDKKLQYDYYFYSIRKYKRPFQKWLKNQDTIDIQNIQEYYGYSIKQAYEVLSILSREQLDYIAQKLDKGGN